MGSGCIHKFHVMFIFPVITLLWFQSPMYTGSMSFSGRDQAWLQISQLQLWYRITELTKQGKYTFWINTQVTLGDRAFICAAPKLWNSLPVSVRKAETLLTFKTLWKTHLFAHCRHFLISLVKLVLNLKDLQLQAGALRICAVEYIYTGTALYKLILLLL